jgi:hypothetical protein
MTTTIYQKFVSRYAETFTLIEIYGGDDYCTAEIIPSGKVSKLNEEAFEELLSELRDAENEKASWSDDDEEFSEEDARSAHHQKWDEIDSFFDKM